MSEEKKDFVVKDRRIFADEGKDKDQKKTEKAPAQGKAKVSPPKKEPEPEISGAKAPKRAQPEKVAAAEEPETETQLPQINFLTFVMSLNASALVNLGLVEDPASHAKVKNLPLAKQTIDMLGMLQEKTRGNLTADEENLLKHFLYELRMIYVKEKE